MGIPSRPGMNGGISAAAPARRRSFGIFVVFFFVAAGVMGAGLFFPELTLPFLCCSVILAGVSAVFVMYGAARERWGEKGSDAPWDEPLFARRR